MGVALAVVLAASAAPAYALVDPNHVVVNPAGNDLTTQAQTWLRDYSGAIESEWTTQSSGAAADAAIAKRGLSVSRFLPAIGRVLPVVGGAIAAYEVCDTFVSAGCWLFQRDDTDTTKVNGYTWTLQEVTTSGCVAGHCRAELYAGDPYSYFFGTPTGFGAFWLLYDGVGGVPEMTGGCGIDGPRYADLMEETGTSASCTHPVTGVVTPASRATAVYRADNVQPSLDEPGDVTLTPQADSSVPNQTGAIYDIPADSNWHSKYVTYLNTLPTPQRERIIGQICLSIAPTNCGTYDPYPPVTVPEPETGETYTAYIERLQDLGLLGNAVELADPQDVPSLGSNVVVSIDPEAGTEIDLGTATETERTVTVRHNPDYGDAETGTGWSAPPVSGVDLSPLTDVPVGCSTFPFGVFCWIADGLASWDASGSCPQFDVPFDHGELPFDFCQFEPAMEIVRPVIVLLAAFSLAYLFAAAAMGFGGASNED